MLENLDKIDYDTIKLYVNIDEPSTQNIVEHKLFIVGPAKSGKDTLAVALAKYAMFGRRYYNYRGSTSLTMLPYVLDAAIKLDTRCEVLTLPEFYDLRGECRTFWYNVIKAYRELDPYFIINEDGSDLFVGSRDWGEIETAVSCVKRPLFIVCKSDNLSDPTWPHTHDEVLQILLNRFKLVRGEGVVEFEYKQSNFELFLAIQRTARNIGLQLQEYASFIPRNVKFERHGVKYDGVLTGRF